MLQLSPAEVQHKGPGARLLIPAEHPHPAGAHRLDDTLYHRNTTELMGLFL